MDTRGAGPNPAKKTAAARVRAEHAVTAAAAAREAALLELRSPAPGRPPT